MAQPSVHSIQRGQVLLAHPLLEDENFKRGVVLLADHDSNGSLGFILNDPAIYHLPEALVGDWPDLPLYIGGPVEKDALFFLHCRPDLIPGSHSIDGFLHWGGDYETMRCELLAGRLEVGHIRFFAGYAGWSAHQLYEEIEEGSWAVIPGNIVNCLGSEKDLYQSLREHLPPDFKFWGNAPRNPTFN